KVYGLILSVNQSSVYLARYKNAHTSKVKKQVEKSTARKQHPESKQDPINSDSNTKDYVFGSPEYRAAVQKEPEENFRKSNMRNALVLKHPKKATISHRRHYVKKD